MPCNWKCAMLSELYEISGGLNKPKEAFGTGAPFLNFNTILKNDFLPARLESHVEVTTRECERYSIKRGDVFLNRTSETPQSLAYTCIAVRDFPGAVFSGFAKRLRPRQKGILDPLYAAGYFRSEAFRSQILSSSAAYTTRASIDRRKLEQLRVYYPSIEEQKRIGTLLYTISEKLRTNTEFVHFFSEKMENSGISESAQMNLFQMDSPAQKNPLSSLLPLYMQKLSLLSQEASLLEQMRTEWIQHEITTQIEHLFNQRIGD